MTRYTIGDIHGGAKTLRALLSKINLRREDRLYLVGDYIDRGPDSRGVLDIVLDLIDSGHDVRPVRGNHEDLLLRCYTGQHDDMSPFWMEGWGNHALKSFGVFSVHSIPARYLAFFELLPLVQVDDDFVFVHGGLDMDRDDPVTESSPETMLWGSNGEFGKDKLQGRTLVTGHNIHTVEEIKASLKTNHINLDNGAFSNGLPDHGNLVAFNMDTKELALQPWLDGDSAD